jgi:hypothetical protein
MPFITDVEIEIKYDNTYGSYVAIVDKRKAGAKRGGCVRWKIKRRDGFPNNATVIIQFVDSSRPPKSPVDGPFFDGAKTHGKYATTDNSIINLIGGSTADGGFNYTISYDDAGTEKMLLDPEIVVDGNAPLVIKFFKGLEAGLRQLRRDAQVQPKRRAAQKESAAAKRSTKRKAKKR